MEKVKRVFKDSYSTATTKMDLISDLGGIVGKTIQSAEQFSYCGRLAIKFSDDTYIVLEGSGYADCGEYVDANIIPMNDVNDELKKELRVLSPDQLQIYNTSLIEKEKLYTARLKEQDLENLRELKERYPNE